MTQTCLPRIGSVPALAQAARGSAQALLAAVAVFAASALCAPAIAASPSTSTTIGAPLQGAPAQSQRVTRWVDPFIGTGGTGHTFPGASVPFGMVAPSPDTADRGWDHASGYQRNAPRILGFSATHISGAGIGELGDVLLMPALDERWSRTTTDFSAPHHTRLEAARPGYYRTRLPEHGVTVELTASQRVAWQRYSFDRPGRVQVLADFQHGILFGDGPRVTQAQVTPAPEVGEISGTVHAKNWVEREASFVLRFSQPISSIETLPAKPGELAPRYVLGFDLGAGRVLEARVALSTVDVAGARGNLAADPNTSFATTQMAADEAWSSLLGRVQIDAPARQKRIFYTALYHCFLHPSDIADADGRVRGPTGSVLTARGGSYYSTLSLWDTFRGLQPLITLLAPERVRGIVTTLLDHHRAMGYLPLWTAWGRETWTMIGNPALPVLADAVAKGLVPDLNGEILQAMVETSTKDRANAPDWAQRSWADYEQFGYLPIDKGHGEAVSKSLEYGIGDDAVARVAKVVGSTDLTERFARRAQGYRQLWDAQTRTMRGRDSHGAWRTPFDPLVPTSPMNNPGDYTEANAWQYTLTPALHDPLGLRDLVGGPKALGDWLDAFFALQAPGDNKHLGQEGLIGQYAHGNEPSHHIAFLYAYSDRPEKGHALVRRIAKDFYSDQPNGITGNDDCGQMSAWLVLATLGLYPAVPASGQFIASPPLVRSAAVALPGGKTLRIRADVRNAGIGQLGGQAEAQSDGWSRGRPDARRGIRILLNGRELDPLAVGYRDVMNGGLLHIATSH